MKNVHLIILTNCLLYSFGICHSQWKMIDFVSNSSNNTDEKIEVFFGKGTFTNNLTSNSPLKIKLRLSKNNEDGSKYQNLGSYYNYMDSLITESESLHRKRILNKKFLVKDYERQKFNYENRLGQLWFTLYENNDLPIRFDTTNRIIILLKLFDNSEIYWVDDTKLSTNNYWTFFAKKNSESAKIYKAITDPNPVRVIISHGTSKYKFSIDGYKK